MTSDLFPEVQPHAGVEDDNQRFTTPHALAWCRRIAGVTEYDLDVAACEESHHAANWYSKADDGLVQPWYGDVWCNPPWDDIGAWVRRAWRAWSEPVHDGLSLISISMLLPGNRTHRPWWQEFVEPYRDRPMQAERLSTHYPPERFAYGAPGNPRAVGVGEPNFTSVLLVWRRR